MGEKRKLNFSIGIFDDISDSIIEKIKNESKNCEIYGVGVYSDKIVIEEYFTYPMKNLEERMDNVKQIEGVDFVFPVDTIDIEEMKKIVQQECVKFLENKM